MNSKAPLSSLSFARLQAQPRSGLAALAVVAAAALSACAAGNETQTMASAQSTAFTPLGGSGGSAPTGFEGGSGGVDGLGGSSDGAGPVGGQAAVGGSGGAAGSEAGTGGAPCEGFFDSLAGHTIGVQTGGELGAEGWTVTNNGNRLDWPHQRIGTEGILEFDVKGLGGDQECGGTAAGSRGKCRLWWLGADDQGDAALSQWSATGRNIASNFLCDPPDACDPADYIDKVRLGVTWHRPSPKWSDTAFEWNPSVWYHMRVVWTCERLQWFREDEQGEILLVQMTPAPAAPDGCYAPENDPEAAQLATEMTFMVGGGIFGAVGATFRNVSYTPTRCASVLPAAP